MADEEVLSSYRPKIEGGERQEEEYFALELSGPRRILEALSQLLLGISLVAPPAEEIAALSDLSDDGSCRGIVERTATTGIA